MNVLFDSNDADKENDYSSNNSINIICERCTTINKREVLGSFIKDKNKEHLINAIFHQADHEDLMKTLGFPNQKNWLKRNIPIWFASGGFLAE
jgi:homospermidine synthase